MERQKFTRFEPSPAPKSSPHGSGCPRTDHTSLRWTELFQQSRLSLFDAGHQREDGADAWIQHAAGGRIALPLPLRIRPKQVSEVSVSVTTAHLFMPRQQSSAAIRANHWHQLQHNLKRHHRPCPLIANPWVRSPFRCVDLCYMTNAFAMLLWQKVLVLQSPRSDTRSLLRWQSRQKANIQAQIIPQSIIWAYSTSSRETFPEKGNAKLPSLHSSPSSKSGLHPKRAPPKEPTNTGQKLSGPANLGVDAVLLRIDQNKIHNYNAYGNMVKYQMRRIIFVYITLWTCINHILTIYGTGHEIYILLVCVQYCCNTLRGDRAHWSMKIPIWHHISHCLSYSSASRLSGRICKVTWKILPASHLPKLVSTLTLSPRTYTVCGDDSNWFTHLFLLKHFEMLEFGNRKRTDFAPSPFLESHT